MSNTSFRTERPVYQDHLPPCNHACPAGENIQAWLNRAETGDYRGAWESLVRDNPLPAIMGRVCYHPCEPACNRAQKDQAVSIHAVERFLGDQAMLHGWQFQAGPASGKHVLVVGSGPSGLSAAYHLALLGHQVTIHEAGPTAGGMMRVGIPKYRLPREVLDAEIARIEKMGVVIRVNTKVDDLARTLADGKFDAAFLAVGAHVAKRAYIPAGDACKILDALSVLRDVDRGDPPLLGRRVLIYGGGNTALDAARTAKRLGATETLIVYRRNREKMPAHDFEVEEALQEGIQFKWLSTIKKAGDTTFTVEKMQLDAAGFPQSTGEFETLEADSLVLALGQDVDLTFLENLPGLVIKNGVVQVDAGMLTGHPGVFAGGDMVPADRTVTVAVGHGKKAARNIDAYLRAADYTAATKHTPAGFDRINSWYYPDAPVSVQPVLEAFRRQTTFDEVVGGLDETNALFEARRCLSCGNCFECDSCFTVCPETAVIKLGAGKRYEFDYNYCTGCGNCFSECPCGAIDMIAEPAM